MKEKCNCEQALELITALEYIEYICLNSKPEGPGGMAQHSNLLRCLVVTQLALGHDEEGVE